MIQQRIFVFFISILVVSTTMAQEEEPLDTIKVKESYGLRIGVDISKPIIAQLETEVEGLEFVADYRVKGNLYAAVEFGSETKTVDEEYINFTSDGTYIKIGGNFNAYENWEGMTNEIFIGLRYGMASFTQTLNSYTPNSEGTYFIADTVEPATEFTGLDAQWIELVFGLKVETFKNVYLGASMQLKNMISTTEPEGFKNLRVPGFNRVSLNDKGVGFNYTITYLIPLIKK
jgi:hypothetical protein